MKIQQKRLLKNGNWEVFRDDGFDPALSNFVLVFSSTEILDKSPVYSSIRKDYPTAVILLASTAGEILDTKVDDDTITLTAVKFEKTELKTSFTHIDEVENSFVAGKTLASQLKGENLRCVFVISDGQKVNGSELVEGLQAGLPKGTIITGGLAGDGARFQKTLVGLNEQPVEGRMVAVGFYSDDLFVSYGSVGGWDPFGPERLITKSKGNIVYELDNKPILDVYKLYLGEYASELPGSGLLFPLSIRSNDKADSLVRTILAVNEDDKSLTFAGNMPEGAFAQLMKANLDRLIEGASTAASNSLEKGSVQPELAILISCVGRKLVLDQRIEEEVEIIRTIYGSRTAITGFYSYGEISPSFNFLQCELHNQTMTITTLTEG